MAMAMTPMRFTVAATVKPYGLRGLFSTLTSTSPFFPPPSNQARPLPPEPSDELFVSGLSKRTSTERLREAFAFWGEVVDARVVTDRESGKSKGFGFVRYATIEDAAEGIEGMNGEFLDGWLVHAEYARRPPLLRNNAGPPSYHPGYGSSFGRR